MNTKDMRRIIIQAAHHAKHGHIPSALSLVEIMKAYLQIESEDDVMILSKGHGCLALYTMLHLQGHVTLDEVLNFGNYLFMECSRFFFFTTSSAHSRWCEFN